MEGTKVIKFQDLVPRYTRKDLGGEAFLCDLDSIDSKEYRNIYEPNEDTYLLIDALNLESKNSIVEQNPSTVLEIGIGSGAVINSLQMLMRRDGCKVDQIKFTGTDINPLALEAAKKVSEANKNTIEYKECIFADGIETKMDIIIFNPPYVVTSEEELLEAQEKKNIAAAWAGGTDGIQVLIRVVPTIKRLLSENGVFYLLLIQENLKVINLFEQHGFEWSVVMKREVMMENQVIIKL